MIILILCQPDPDNLCGIRGDLKTEKQISLIIAGHAALVAPGKAASLLAPGQINPVDPAVLALYDSSQPYYLPGCENFTQLLPLVNNIIIMPPAENSRDLAVAKPALPADRLPGLGFRQIDFEYAALPDSDIVCWQRQPAETVISDLAAAGDCDLHLHTNKSDGSYTVRQLIAKVRRNGLKTFAITDHDTTAALNPAEKHMKTLPTPAPRFIPGIEISVDYDQEVHLLGYFPYGRHEDLNQLIRSQQYSREQRNIDMIRRLQNMGYSIDMEKFLAAGDGTVGRLQAAKILTAAGYTPDIQTAFQKLLNPGKPAYIERERPRIDRAIWQIRQAGGVAVLAHPHLYGWCEGQAFVSRTLLDKLAALRQAGLQGVEAFHGEATPEEQIEIAAAGRALNLILTAGSDDHGDNKQHTSMYKAGTPLLPANEALVAAALIRGPERDGQNTWLLARRSEPGFGCGLWEVPGGKVEKGETTRETLQRELMEELGVVAEAGEVRFVLSHDYPGRRIVLVFHSARISGKEPGWQLRVHDDIGYFTARQALELPLLEADIALFARLAESEAKEDPN